MGSLFKPSTTVVQAPSQQTVTSQIPEYFKEIQERTLRRAENVFNEPFTAFQGQRVAQLSPQEQQVANVFSNQILPQAGQLAQIGAQTFDTATAQQYMNPYTNNVIQSTLSDLGEAFGQQQRSMAATAVGAGAFGGSREGVERALSRERYLDQVADTSARLRQAGFESGAQRFAADRAAQLQSAQAQLSGLAGAAAGLGQAGSLARGIEQAELTEAFRDFIEERDFPAGQVRQMIGALAGAPIRTYGEERSALTGTPVGAPSPFAQIAGAGQALAAFSDIRLKEDIKLVGKSPSGINIYNFKYIGDDTTYQGVMAHQVPKASTPNKFGYLMVDYSKIDVEFKKVN
tara:strand:+ start:205 stop:1239 length:1035 start_codon:yes stop_codon:yes gene_type:complete